MTEPSWRFLEEFNLAHLRRTDFPRVLRDHARPREPDSQFGVQYMRLDADKPSRCLEPGEEFDFDELFDVLIRAFASCYIQER